MKVNQIAGDCSFVLIFFCKEKEEEKLKIYFIILVYNNVRIKEYEVYNSYNFA